MKAILKDKVILITGGTGFLGQALATEILKFGPKAIRIFSRDEVKHYKFQQKFGENKIFRNLVGDVRDYDRLKKAMRGCDIVIHTAALKRIDMIEYNVEESIKTNILGTANLVRAALENEVKKVVFISTDKACLPVNSYGACKFVSEKIITESNFNKGDSKTVFTSVRYGNVIGSTGSVIPFFQKKIEDGEDVPLTDPNMTRFLITAKEAVHLVFNAIKYSTGGEIFIPRLPSFKISDLIGYLKNKSDAKNKIKVIGLRPGEKLNEIMISDVEAPRTVEFHNMLVIRSEIEKYQQNQKIYHYLKNCKKFNSREFSSEHHLLDAEGIEKFFGKRKI